eukprot:1190234-Prorocentrum_minimum.AAC.3
MTRSTLKRSEAHAHSPLLRRTILSSPLRCRALGSCIAFPCPASESCPGILPLPGYPALHPNPAVARVPCPASCRYQGTLPCIRTLPLPGYPALHPNLRVRLS